MENQEKKMKLRENLKALATKLISVFQEYPVALISIVVAALIGAILVKTGSNEDLTLNLERGLLFLLTLAIQALTFEEFFPKKWVPRLTGYGISTLLSALYVFILSVERETFLGMDNEMVLNFVWRVFAVHGAIMVGLSIWHMFRRTEEDFEVYATKSFLALLQATVIYGLFALGLALLIWVFNELIFDTDEFLSQVEIFLAGGIYVPMCLKAISGKNEAPGKFSRFCIQYVLQPLQLLAFAIIYVYILKIFVTTGFASTRIFSILGFLFVCGMPIWTMAHGIQQTGFFAKFTKFVPYSFLPFVILQIWSISLRIGEYGVTSDRYTCVILIVGELIYFVLYFLHHRGNKQALSWTLFAAMALTFIVLLCPGLSNDDVVIRSQMNRLTKFLSIEDPSEGEIYALKTSYRSINWLGYNGKKALNERLTAEQKSRAEKYLEYNYNDSGKWVSLYASRDFTDVDVSAYRRIHYVASFYASSSKQEALDSRIIPLRLANNSGETNETIQADLSSYLDWVMSTYTERYNNNFSLEDHAFVQINDQYALYLTHISIEYECGKKSIRHLEIRGYLMER